MEAWNAVFTEAIMAESLGLVDRPTALKGPDGQWQGVVKTDIGERKAVATDSKTHSLMSAGGMYGRLQSVGSRLVRFMHNGMTTPSAIQESNVSYRMQSEVLEVWGGFGGSVWGCGVGSA